MLLNGKELVTEVATTMRISGLVGADENSVAQTIGVLAEVVAGALDAGVTVEIPGLGMVGPTHESDIEAIRRSSKAWSKARKARARKAAKDKARPGRKVGGKSISPTKRPGKTARKERVARARADSVTRGGIRPRNRKSGK